MTDPMKREIERAIYDAEHPSGMSTHDGMARISAATLRRLYELTDKYQWQVRDTCVRAEKAEAQRDALLEQRDELRRALEIIAVGDATNPQAQAAEELTALGYWKATAHEAQKHSNAELKLYEGEKG